MNDPGKRRRFLPLILLGLLFPWGEAFPQAPPALRMAVGEAGKPLDRSEVARYLEHQMQKALGDERKVVRIKELLGGEKVTLPPGDFSWEARLPERFYQGGAVPVSLILRAGGEKDRELRFQARVEVLADVVVARNSIRRHQTIDERDLQLVNKNIALFPGDVVMDPQEIVGKRMVLSVNPQEVLRKSMVEVPPLIKKGDRVTLLAETVHFRITGVGEAREEGRAGERIRVVNVSSQKEVFGRVVDDKTVRVDF